MAKGAAAPQPSLAARPPVNNPESDSPTNAFRVGYVESPLPPAIRETVKDLRSKLIETQRERFNEMLATATTKEEIARIVHLAALEIAESEMPRREQENPDAVRRKNESVHESNTALLLGEIATSRTPGGKSEAERLADSDKRRVRNNDVTNDNVDFIAREMKIGAATRFLGGH